MQAQDYNEDERRVMTIVEDAEHIVCMTEQTGCGNSSNAVSDTSGSGVPAQQEKDETAEKNNPQQKQSVSQRFVCAASFINRGGAGSLSYYKPWGNVVLFYAPCDPNGSLYELGTIISGKDDIDKLKGSITISVYEK